MIFDAYMTHPPSIARDTYRPLGLPYEYTGSVQLAVTDRAARQLLKMRDPGLRLLILGPDCPEGIEAALREFIDASAGARDASERARNATATLAKKLMETMGQ